MSFLNSVIPVKFFSVNSIAPVQRPLIFAHRGASDSYAEHTRAAYLEALAAGADGIEADIHLTKDGYLVLNHDSTINRTSDGRGSISRKKLDELRQLDVSSWKNPEIPAEYGGLCSQFLTLGELLEILSSAGRPMHCALELKKTSPYGRELEDDLLRVLVLYGWNPIDSTIGNVTVSLMSFNAWTVEYLSDFVPTEHLCQLVEISRFEKVRRRRKKEGKRASGLYCVFGHLFSYINRSKARSNLDNELAQIVGPDVEYMEKASSSSFIQRWQDQGKTFRVWDVAEVRAAEILAENNIQQITTDYPKKIKEFFDGREN